jgi:riboflavin kinase/FMN adenylyltransferase
LGDIGVDIVEPIGTGERWGEADAKLSSSTIRTAIGNGQVDIAGRMLGRWHAVAGTVTTGAKRGRGLGFPTANLAYGRVCVPKTGIYATFFTVWDQRSPLHGSCWPAATSVGTNPTFTATDPGQRQPPVTIETYVLDRDLGDQLYGLEVEVSFVARLRDEQRFESIDGLVAQMQRDVDLARVVLTEPRKAFTLKPSR